MTLDLTGLVREAGNGSVRSAARLISLIEDDPTMIPTLFKGMAKWLEPRLVIGFTGAPGVGKSTLVDTLVRLYRKRNPEKRIAVLAVDPSSPFTGGAVLGDRVRMMDHASDPMVFIRSLAARGHLGGLTLGIKGSVRVMGLLGCDIVFIETVGVGQSEIEVAGTADLVAVILAPGMGDGIQMLKAGLMEAADLFVLNKADKAGADGLAMELERSLSLAEGEALPVFMTSATQGEGIVELLDGIEESGLKRRAEIEKRRSTGIRDDVYQALLEGVRTRAEETLHRDAGDTGRLVDEILAGNIGLSDAVDTVLERIDELGKTREEK